jgi:O-methyltransferase
LYSRVFYIIYPFRSFFLFLYNFSTLTVWASRNNKKIGSNDFFKPLRQYTSRIKGFELIVNKFSLEENPITYLEFGVAGGTSFRWWVTNAKHSESRFYGFDTFEGLPEKWGLFYNKGDMKHEMLELNDSRHQFIKGLFQDTFLDFINTNLLALKSGKRKIIHLDADLFSATLFVLSQIYPFLKKGDIIIFDEFSVANHEFFAADLFQKTFYIKLEPISAINNFYQLIFQVV